LAIGPTIGGVLASPFLGICAAIPALAISTKHQIAPPKRLLLRGYSALVSHLELAE
jgi:hypothetical protein